MAAALLAIASTGRAQVPARAIEGRVVAETDSVPLSGVRVRVLVHGQRASSDASGRFRLEAVPRVVVRLVLERIGLVPDTVTVGADAGTLTVRMRARPVLLSPIVTEAAPIARERFELIAQTSTVSLNPLEIAAAPGLAEPDVARVVQLLPGTVAKNDFSTGFNVRGGEADQNLIRLDGITVFNPSHLGGLFSTFDPAAVERVDFITGAFPAGFGGRLSSVLDVELRDGSATRTSVNGAVSLVSSKLMVDGPIGNSGVRYLVGGRRTYADAFADQFSDDTFTYYFTDGLGKMTAPLRSGGEISLMGYWGRDALVFPWVDAEPGRDGVDLAFAWGNRLAGIAIRQPIGRVVLEQHAGVSAFSTTLEFTPDVHRFDNTARVLTLATSLGAAPGGGHQIRLGAGLDQYDMTYVVDNLALGVTQLDLSYRPRVWSAYLDDQWQPVSWLMLRPGLRVEYVTRDADFTAVAPRAGAKLFLTKTLALIGSVGRYYQAIHSIRDQELPITIFDVWIGADRSTPVARSDHVVAGFEKWFGERVSLTVEGYDKSYADVLIRNREDDPRVKGDEFTPADGYARGVDVLLRRHLGEVTGWLAYSFARTERYTATDTFPPAHDRRHTINAVLQAPGPLGSRMGVRWGYGSPLPYTGIVGQWLHREYNPITNQFDGWEEETISTTINGERYPYYSRLDVSFRWQFDKWGGTFRPYLQVVNLYNRQNVFVYTFDYSRVPATRSGFTQLPILPTIGLEFEW